MTKLTAEEANAPGASEPTPDSSCPEILFKYNIIQLLNTYDKFCPVKYGSPKRESQPSS